MTMLVAHDPDPPRDDGCLAGALVLVFCLVGVYALLALTAAAIALGVALGLELAGELT